MVDKIAITKAAQKFIEKGQIDKAIAEWEKLLKESPDGNVYNTIGDLYLRRNQKREAIEAFAKAANIFREDGFYLKAIGLYRKILNISTSDTDALVALAELNAEKGLVGNANQNLLAVAEKFIKEGAVERAAELYKKVLKLTPSNIDLPIKMTELYLKTGLKKEAVTEYLSIASDYSGKGEYQKAQEFYNKAINIDPQNVSSLIGLGRIAENTNNIQQAYEYFTKAMSFDQDNNEVLFNYSRLAIETDNVDNAKQALTKLIEKEPSNNQYKKLIGNIYLKKGLLEKALDEMLPFIDEELQAGKWSEALKLLNNFKDINPEVVKPRFITIYKGENNKEAAISEIRKLTEVLESKNLLENALQLYKEILELNPSDEKAKDRIKELEKTLGVKPEPTIEESVEAILKNAEIPTAKPAPPSAKVEEKFEEKLTEADFYAQQGLKEEAIKIYEELLSIAPDNDEIRKKLRALKPEERLEIKVSLQEEEMPTPASTEAELMGVFDKFKKGIDEKLGEDYESHYNLGIAYKEMGMIEEAIKELQVAAKDPKKTVQSSIMLAICYMDKKLYPLAIKELKKTMESISPDDGSYIGIKFDLARAYEKNNEYDNALKLYMEIYAQNPNFRDIKHKIENIKSLMSEEKPKTKKGRVSYI
jgi:tetratricopeptide (TPR) repeat protein